MAYSKQTWSDREIEKPNTYQVIENQDETVTLVPKPGQVTNEGTKVTAARMNHIEDGIDGAVCKSGDTMTGTLGIQNETYQMLIFKNNNGVEISHVRGESKEDGNRVVIRSTNLTTNKIEDYHLPIATATEDTWYDVLTTKSPVTVAQGGTGATTADGACGNIGAVKKSGDIMTGPLIVSSPNSLTVIDPNSNTSGLVAFNNRLMRNAIIGSGPDSRFFIEVYTPNGVNGARENYGIPAPTVTDGFGGFFDILTTKSPVTVAQGGTGATTAAGALNNFLNQTSRTSIGTWNNSTSVNTYASFDENTVAVYFQLWYAGNIYGGATEERFRSNSNDDNVILLGENDSGGITRIGVSINWATNRVTLKHDKWADQYWNLSIYKRT